MSEKKYPDREIFRRLLILAKPYWLHILGVFLIGLLEIPIILLTPVPIKIAVDSVLSSLPLPQFIAFFIPEQMLTSKMSLLWIAVIMQVGVVLVMHVQYMGLNVLQTFTGEKLLLTFRGRLFRHVQRLSFAFHDARGSSDSIYRIFYDTSAIQNILIYAILPFITSFFSLFAMIFIMMRLNFKLAVVALMISPILFYLTQFYNKRMRPKYRHVKNLESGVLKHVQEVMTSFRVVKAFGREEHEEERFIGQSEKALQKKTHLSFFESAYGLCVNITTAVGTSAVLFIGVQSVMNQEMTLGELLMVIAYLTQLYGPLKNISRKTASIQSHLVSANRVFELMDEIPEVFDKPHAKHIKRVKGAIEFQNVRFSYDGQSEIIKDISFKITAGSRVGISGTTGSGKTTLVSLLPRFYDPVQGTILMDGHDIKNYNIADLRNQFSIVLQDPVLFSATIQENIQYAKPDATENEVLDAARAANAHDFITTLPSKYNTLVGERGMRLSGGERQRISLARAFLKNAPILILDEPTSSVDTATESLIMDAMERLMINRTTFMIAHRLSTLTNCDVRLELKDGKLQEQKQ